MHRILNDFTASLPEFNAMSSPGKQLVKKLRDACALFRPIFQLLAALPLVKNAFENPACYQHWERVKSRLDHAPASFTKGPKIDGKI